MLTVEQVSRSIVDDKNKIILIWVAKSGCTTAIKMMFKHMGILDEASSYESIHNYRSAVYHTKYICTMDMITDPSYKKIKIVRNPYARAVSTYLHCQHHNLTKADMTFRNFLLKLKNDPKSLPDDVIYHSEIQYNEAVDPYVTDLIKLENLRDGIKQFNTKYDTKLSVEGLEDSPHHTVRNKNLKIFVGYNTYQEIIKIGIPEYKMFYNADIKNIVESIYAVDIEKYSYKL